MHTSHMYIIHIHTHRHVTHMQTHHMFIGTVKEKEMRH